jgi:D-alanine-D-alanine ligase
VSKPVCQGSSFGLRFVNRTEEWGAALRDVLEQDQRALVEERIEGRELTVGILEGEALPVVEIAPKGGLYDYQHKYTTGATQYFCPAPLSPEVTRRVQELGCRSFEAIGGRDYGRVDLLLRNDGLPFVLEVNTLPGMTETSLLPKAALAKGLNFGQLCQRMVELAVSRTASVR